MTDIPKAIPAPCQECERLREENEHLKREVARMHAECRQATEMANRVLIRRATR